jgi:hypothetical protein
LSLFNYNNNLASVQAEIRTLAFFSILGYAVTDLPEQNLFPIADEICNFLLPPGLGSSRSASTKLFLIAAEICNILVHLELGNPFLCKM